MTTFSVEILPLSAALNPDTTKNSDSPVIATTNDGAAVPANKDDSGGGTNTSAALSSGNATNAQTAIKKSNETVSHACDTSSYVGQMAAAIGAFAGNVVRGIRAAIKAILEALGFNSDSSCIVSSLKKIAQYIQDVTKFIKWITDGLVQFLAYVNALKQLLAYILSLPTILLTYFADCVKLIRNQIVTSYLKALNANGDVQDADISALSNAVNDVTTSVKQFTQAVGTLATTTAAAVLTIATPLQTPGVPAAVQQQATANVFSYFGVTDTSKGYAKP